jgi:hypothetical protein
MPHVSEKDKEEKNKERVRKRRIIIQFERIESFNSQMLKMLLEMQL